MVKNVTEGHHRGRERVSQGNIGMTQSGGFGKSDSRRYPNTKHT